MNQNAIYGQKSHQTILQANSNQILGPNPNLMKNTVASKQNVEQSNNNTGNLNLSGLVNEHQLRNNTPSETRKSSNRGHSAKEDRATPKQQKAKKVGEIHASSNFMMRSQDMKKTMTS